MTQNFFCLPKCLSFSSFSFLNFILFFSFGKKILLCFLLKFFFPRKKNLFENMSWYIFFGGKSDLVLTHKLRFFSPSPLFIFFFLLFPLKKTRKCLRASFSLLLAISKNWKGNRKPRKKKKKKKKVESFLMAVTTLGGHQRNKISETETETKNLLLRKWGNWVGQNLVK